MSVDPENIILDHASDELSKMAAEELMDSINNWIASGKFINCKCGYMLFYVPGKVYMEGSLGCSECGFQLGIKIGRREDDTAVVST